MSKISESIDRTPMNFNTEDMIGEIIHWHTDRYGNIPEPGKLIEFFTTLRDNFQEAVNVTGVMTAPPAPERDDESIHSLQLKEEDVK